MEKLCRICAPDEACVFKQRAESIATHPDIGPEEKFEQIKAARIAARFRECPQVNDVDPDFPGKAEL